MRDNPVPFDADRHRKIPMHATLVHVRVMPAHVAEFIGATAANHRASVREPGNLRFDVLQSPEDPARFILYEVYRDAGAAAAHKQTAHYAAWRDTVAPWMAEPRHGEPFHMLYPEPVTS